MTCGAWLTVYTARNGKQPGGIQRAAQRIGGKARTHQLLGGFGGPDAGMAGAAAGAVIQAGSAGTRGVLFHEFRQTKARAAIVAASGDDVATPATGWHESPATVL